MPLRASSSCGVTPRPGGCFGRCCCRRRSPGCRLVGFPQPYALIGPMARRRARSFVQYTLLAIALFLLVLWIGSEAQQGKAKKAPDTLFLYTTPHVCGATLVEPSAANNSSSLSLHLESYDSVESLALASAEEEVDETTSFVAHCGDCGQCSNPHDIQIYDDTRNTLFENTVTCAQKAFVLGRTVAHACMDESVGFTDGCRSCWVENIMCDIRNCLFTCLWHTIFSQIETGEETQDLNACTQCDEKRCGIAFVQCAGANRRRTGILSDIGRDAELEVCQSVQTEWWRDERVQQILAEGG